MGDATDVVLHGFKCDKHLSLDLDALLVVVLVPDLFISVELPNLLIEVGAGENLTVLGLVGGSVVAWVGVVVVTVVVFRGPSGRLVGKSPLFGVGLKTDCVDASGNGCCNNKVFEHLVLLFVKLTKFCKVIPAIQLPF